MKLVAEVMGGKRRRSSKMHRMARMSRMYGGSKPALSGGFNLLNPFNIFGGSKSRASGSSGKKSTKDILSAIISGPPKSKVHKPGKANVHSRRSRSPRRSR